MYKAVTTLFISEPLHDVLVLYQYHTNGKGLPPPGQGT